MAIIKPFKAVRPAEHLSKSIAALPYDVYNRKEAVNAVKNKPLLFLNIDRPETMFPDDYDMYAPEVYQKANERLWNMLRNGELIQDNQDAYYLYELTMNGRMQTGIVACASIDDYLNNVIKKHEKTREEKEQDRSRHIDTCGMQTGPIFLAYRYCSNVDRIIRNTKVTEPCCFDFESDDGIKHRGWIIRDIAQIAMLQNAFAEIKDIYIADGHHRAASAVKVGLKRREQYPEYTGKEEFNYFLSVLFADKELMIMDYNRVVKDLNGLSNEEFIRKVQVKYIITESDCAVSPKQKGETGMCLDGKWYLLTLKEEYRKNHPVDGLDVSILEHEIFTPILKIDDPRTSTRIDFVGGIRGLEELERRVATDCRAAFSMYPTSINELFGVADAGLLMPPKSTWFEPKLRSGLFLHRIDI